MPPGPEEFSTPKSEPQAWGMRGLHGDCHGKMQASKVTEAEQKQILRGNMSTALHIWVALGDQGVR